jgi:5-methylcytosine-specific restriction endonuclease McrA
MITDKKLSANRANSVLGGAALQAQWQRHYLENPRYCLHCSTVIPWERRTNKFCDRSCAASYNNVKVPKRQSAKPLHPCRVCEKPTKNVLYCSTYCSGQSRVKPFSSDRRKLIKKQINERYYSKLRAQTPPDADLKAIREFYKNRPPGYEVDHIIPISRGGLHTLENLQYLPVRENRKKSNKLI